jgi:2-iminoacetate synthase ThiH
MTDRAAAATAGGDRGHAGSSAATPEDAELLAMPLEDLLAAARAVRDGHFGTRITFSPKVFIPLTMLCQDRCGYCTFAKPPARLSSAYLSPEQVLAVARAGASAGCHEALFTLGRSSVTPRLRSGLASTASPRRSTTSPSAAGS